MILLQGFSVNGPTSYYSKKLLYPLTLLVFTCFLYLRFISLLMMNDVQLTYMPLSRATVLLSTLTTLTS